MPRGIECVAPLDMPPPLANNLLTVLTFVRHGARAPVDSWALENESGTWICDNKDAISPPDEPTSGIRYRSYKRVLDCTSFKPSCEAGGLLVEGMKQHHELGQYFRSYYVDKLKFLRNVYDPFEMYLRSSRSIRCQHSLMSFIHGMYPNSTHNEIITYLTGSGGSEPLNPDPYSCQDMQNAYSEFISTEEYKARANISRAKQKILFDYLKLESDDQNWMWLGDWMYSFICSNQPIPALVTDEMLELAMNDTAYYSGGLAQKYPNEASGSIWRTMFEHLDAVISGERRTKFAFFSAHDATIIGLMTKLGYPFITSIPPYRSYLIFELYNDLTMRVIYNGKPLKMFGGEVFKLTKLRNLVVDSFSKCTF